MSVCGNLKFKLCIHTCLCGVKASREENIDTIQHIHFYRWYEQVYERKNMKKVEMRNKVGENITFVLDKWNDIEWAAE